MKLRPISRKRSLPARSIHSKATISRDTIIAPAWRIRSTASALSLGRREPIASSTTNTSRPRPSRSSTVCSTQTCASLPQTTNCRRSPPGARSRAPSAAAEKSSFSRICVGSSSSRRAATVGPRPLLYCSLASTGTSSARATRNNHWLYSTSAGPSSMAGSRRSWISTTSRVEVAARISMASSFGSTSRFVWLRLARHGRHGQRVLPQP